MSLNTTDCNPERKERSAENAARNSRYKEGSRSSTGFFKYKIDAEDAEMKVLDVLENHGGFWKPGAIREERRRSSGNESSKSDDDPTRFFDCRTESDFYSEDMSEAEWPDRS